MATELGHMSVQMLFIHLWQGQGEQCEKKTLVQHFFVRQIIMFD